ncbi:hypothetical protein NFI96_017645 [Prochilodus magdalenae]|nr:hypothetical protein NFI96_017645 [Prochilodus magdalenae]
MVSRTERRMSVWRGRRESLRGWGREEEEEEGLSSHGFRLKLANTYRLEPLQPFSPHLLQRRAQELLLGAFGDMQYQQDTCRQVACTVAGQLLALAKEQVFDRYRYVVQVSVGQKQNQGLKMASRALWDHEKDNFITLSYENTHLFAVGTVFALYMD